MKRYAMILTALLTLCPITPANAYDIVFTRPPQTQRQGQCRPAWYYSQFNNQQGPTGPIYQPLYPQMVGIVHPLVIPAITYQQSASWQLCR